MLDRLTKRREGSELHPHDWDFRDPTSRKSKARFRSRSSNVFPTVPSPSIFRDVSIPYSLTHISTAPPTFVQYPAPGHVASHLLLIECFHNFKAQTEQSLDFPEGSASQVRPLSQHDTGTWSSYLLVAIKRFKLWITKIEAVIRHSAVFNRYGTGSHLHGAFTENYLPPLDVLFIWYCYLQSPASYERLVASNDFRLLNQICLPWHVFLTVIDHNTLEYTSPPAARTLWRNLVGIPFDINDCFDLKLESDTSAFTTCDLDILEIALAQTDQIDQFQQHRWLRSPALRGTIERAMSRYTEAVLSCRPRMTRQTQQIPMDANFETRSTDSLQLDVLSRLVLNTHRAYHGAWTAFAQVYSIRDDDRPPPPSYDQSQGDLADIASDIHSRGAPSSETCYCWICERIQDENEEKLSSPQMTPLSQVSSPDDIDAKHSVESEFSSDTDETAPHLGLSKEQIKRIKADIRVYRHVEMVREKKVLQRKDSG